MILYKKKFLVDGDYFIDLDTVEKAVCKLNYVTTTKKRTVEKYIEEFVELKFETTVEDLIIENNTIKGVKVRNSNKPNEELQEIYSDNVISAVGRKGAKWLEKICKQYDIKTNLGSVDIGIRYELPDAVMKDVNKYMYEGKFIGYPYPYKDKVRTFCQNPSGFVSSEVYDNNLSWN